VLGVLLLRDLKAIFDKHGSKHVSSEAVITDLKGMEESPWYSIRRDGSPIDARGPCGSSRTGSLRAMQNTGAVIAHVPKRR
jgi:hypothetical protein